MNALTRLREHQGRTPEELAKAAGITVAWYYDLETSPDELDNAIEVRIVALIARELGVAPSVLYGGASGGAASTHQLASLIRKHLDERGQSLEEFESHVGYTVGAALVDPDKFGDCNADGLRALSAAVNVNWFDVLDHLLDAPLTDRSTPLRP